MWIWCWRWKKFTAREAGEARVMVTTGKEKKLPRTCSAHILLLLVQGCFTGVRTFNTVTVFAWYENTQYRFKGSLNRRISSRKSTSQSIACSEMRPLTPPTLQSSTKLRWKYIFLIWRQQFLIGGDRRSRFDVRRPYWSSLPILQEARHWKAPIQASLQSLHRT